MEKENFYKQIKVIGLVTYIPLLLAVGPLSGYFVGSFLQQKFNLGKYCVLISVVLGFIVAFSEVIKIIKVIAGVNKK
jgi:F0F1-type ATP synthase assembly protein I